jgi:hypothetical protein
MVGVFFLVVSFSAVSSFAVGRDIVGTYSDLKFNQQGGDLLGVELRIVMTRNGYQGVVQFAEGGPGELILVNVQVDGKRIKFVIPDDNSNAGSFSGVIGNGVLTGHFQYKGGGAEDVVLKKGKSYWD